VDPLDNLPPRNPQPDEQLPEPPGEFLPRTGPLVPMNNGPTNEQNPFVDPLDNLPPRTPQPREQPEPREVIPQVTPLPPRESAPKTKADPFVDPLDNLPPLTPTPQPKQPETSSPERVPYLPSGNGNTPIDLGVGIQRLPAGMDERFLLESGPEYRRNTLSREIGLDAWERYLDRKGSGPITPRPYWERLSVDDRRRLEQNLRSAPARSSYEPLHSHPRGDLNIEIAKTLPPRSTAHEPLKYEIVVENRGQEMIDHIDVDEAVPATHLLTDVNPTGHFQNNLLRWRLRDIRPGEQRRLAVEVVPSETGMIETTTSIRPSTRVAAVTEVASPTIRLRRSGYRTMALDESVLFTNHVQNLSNATQRGVSIVEKVPKGYRVLRVQDGGLYDGRDQTITWNLASLPAGKTVELSVRLQAESTGELISRVKGSTKEGKAVPILARVFVDRRRTDRVSSRTTQSSKRLVSLRRCVICGCRCQCTAYCGQ
ncbi:MAG: hypothetical protein KDA84_07830, partial [Planctomycetaceae bacterium]|nr:hypothetical protein [Planctomycetaceae bacterium]